jgi:hypothetical protein
VHTHEHRCKNECLAHVCDSVHVNVCVHSLGASMDMFSTWLGIGIHV